MAGINMAKVFIGGIVAAIVMTIGEFVLNDIVLAEANTAAFENMNLPTPGGGAIFVFIGGGFLIGWIMLWLYASLRERMGAGPKTAACAGIVVWMLANLIASVNFAAMGIATVHVAAVATTWALVEYVLAAVAGAYFYSD